MIFQAGQLINYGRQYEATPAATDPVFSHMRPWWIILEDVTAGGKSMFLKDILLELRRQPEMTSSRCRRLVSRAEYLAGEKMKEYVEHKGMLQKDVHDTNVAFKLTPGHDSANPLKFSDLDNPTCGLQNAELIDWGAKDGKNPASGWTYKEVGKHSRSGADERRH